MPNYNWLYEAPPISTVRLQPIGMEWWLWHGVSVFILSSIAILCYSILSEKNVKESTSTGEKARSQGLECRIFGKTVLIRFIYIRDLMRLSLIIMLSLDLLRVIMLDASSPIDVPLALISLYIYRMFIILALFIGVLDTPLFFLSPILSIRQRNILWIGLFLLESGAYSYLQKLFMGTAPLWVRDHATWKSEMAWRWWNNGEKHPINANQ